MFNAASQVLYHSYQDCPIDLNILHSEPFHDHEIVPQLFHGSRALCVRLHNTCVSMHVAQS